MPDDPKTLASNLLRNETNQIVIALEYYQRRQDLALLKAALKIETGGLFPRHEVVAALKGAIRRAEGKA